MTKVLRPSVMRSSEWFKRETRDEQVWKQARLQVLTRDNWTCVYCGFRALKFMQVNHIGAEDNHELDNLETICKPCHCVLHMGIESSNGALTVIESTANQADIGGLRLVGTETRNRNIAILGYRREKRSFFIRKNLFRNRKSRTMSFAKLADQKGPERMQAETGKLRPVHPPQNPENRWLRSF